MYIAYIGIGSNLGDRKNNCARAIEFLKQSGISVRKCSSLHESQPWGVENQPLFLNMAIEIETDYTPQELLRIIKEVEAKIGREKTFPWGPRVVDLDILIFNDMIVQTNELTIPHPYLHKRVFVLESMREIAPDLMHPVLKKSINELFQAFTENC